jgi:hypothetical protein
MKNCAPVVVRAQSNHLAKTISPAGTKFAGDSSNVPNAKGSSKFSDTTAPRLGTWRIPREDSRAAEPSLLCPPIKFYPTATLPRMTPQNETCFEIFADIFRNGLLAFPQGQQFSTAEATARQHLPKESPQSDEVRSRRNLVAGAELPEASCPSVKLALFFAVIEGLPVEGVRAGIPGDRD